MTYRLRTRWLGGTTLLPISLAFVFLTGFVTCYAISTAEHHVYFLWPYISDTGARPSESCYFAQFLNMATSLCLLTSYLRYKVLNSYLDIHGVENKDLRLIVLISFLLAILASFGISLVGNFQEKSVPHFHYSGACLTFGIGATFILVESYLCIIIQPVFTTKTVPLLRAFLGITCIVCSFTNILGNVLAVKIWHNSKLNAGNDQFHWQPGNPGYAWHLVSTFSEWMCGLTFVGFFVSVIPEFSCFTPTVERNLDLRRLNNTPFARVAVQQVNGESRNA